MADQATKAGKTAFDEDIGPDEGDVGTLPEFDLTVSGSRREIVRLLELHKLAKLAAVELTFYRRMTKLVAEGGWMVGSSQCSTQELAWARAEGRMFVDQDGFGYVVRPAASMPKKGSSDG